MKALPGQPLCLHYTGATLANLTGDYSCVCLAGIPYERWTPDMGRWPCRKRHILGLEQHQCAKSDYSITTEDAIDEQLTAMAIRAVNL